MENRIDSKKTALVLIDMQNDICKVGDVAKVIAERRVLQNAARMVDECHKAGIPVFFVGVNRRHDMADVVNTVTDLVLQGKMKPPKEQRVLLEGSQGAQFVEELKLGPNDYIIIKRRRNAFYQTTLELYLRALGIDTLMIGGVATNWGVEGTARDAWDRDYNVIILSDCCASFSHEVHEWALANVFPRLGRVMTSQQAIELRARG